jgi:hypothetical protein
MNTNNNDNKYKTKNDKNPISNACLSQLISLIDECKSLCLFIHKNQEFIKISIKLIDERLKRLEIAEFKNNGIYIDENIFDNINYEDGNNGNNNEEILNNTIEN